MKGSLWTLSGYPMILIHCVSYAFTLSWIDSIQFNSSFCFFDLIDDARKTTDVRNQHRLRDANKHTETAANWSFCSLWKRSENLFIDHGFGADRLWRINHGAYGARAPGLAPRGASRFAIYTWKLEKKTEEKLKKKLESKEREKEKVMKKF